jgi:hypothetical protein
MQASLILNSPLFEGANPQRISAALATSAAELERDIKENIANSKPAGRTYPVSRILRNESRNNRGLGLRRRGRQVILGSNFRRASAPGQPPAIDTGRLINSIRGRRIGPFSYRVATGVVYARPLDNPGGLNRPFFRSRVLLYRERFLQNMRQAYLGK